MSVMPEGTARGPRSQMVCNRNRSRSKQLSTTRVGVSDEWHVDLEIVFS
jgi:hypothetical protein